jgi:hypothetical protein
MAHIIKANVEMIPTMENVWVSFLSLFTYFAYPPRTIPEIKAIIRVTNPNRRCSILEVIVMVPFTIYGIWLFRRGRTE